MIFWHCNIVTCNCLFLGSIDTIRVWNVETGHAMTRLSVSRRKKEVIVWSIAVLADKTIVSGDSHGRLTFWDSTHGEQVKNCFIVAVKMSTVSELLYM